MTRSQISVPIPGPPRLRLLVCSGPGPVSSGLGLGSPGRGSVSPGLGGISTSPTSPTSKLSSGCCGPAGENPHSLQVSA